MVASAKISVKSIHLFLSFSLHRATKLAITRPSLVVQRSACVHPVPHVILHLMKYRLSIFKKMTDRAVEAKLDFDEKQAALFIAS